MQICSCTTPWKMRLKRLANLRRGRSGEPSRTCVWDTPASVKHKSGSARRTYCRTYCKQEIRALVHNLQFVLIAIGLQFRRVHGDGFRGRRLNLPGISARRR